MISNVVFLLCFFIIPIIGIVIGANDKAILISSIFLMMLGIPLYFWYQRSQSLTSTEHILANIWLFIRRSISFISALIFISFLIMFLISDYELGKKLGGALFMLFLALCSIWVGIYGRKCRSCPPQEDIKFHKENKKRYGWRW